MGVFTSYNAYSAVSEAGLENGPFLPLSGGTITGLTNFNGTNLGIRSTHSLFKVPTLLSGGFRFAQDIDWTEDSCSRLQAVSAPKHAHDAANKAYVDDNKGIKYLQTVSYNVTASANTITNVGYQLPSETKLFFISIDSLFITNNPNNGDTLNLSTSTFCNLNDSWYEILGYFIISLTSTNTYNVEVGVDNNNQLWIRPTKTGIYHINIVPFS